MDKCKKACTVTVINDNNKVIISVMTETVSPPDLMHAERRQCHCGNDGMISVPGLWIGERPRE